MPEEKSILNGLKEYLDLIRQDPSSVLPDKSEPKIFVSDIPFINPTKLRVPLIYEQTNPNNSTPNR